MKWRSADPAVTDLIFHRDGAPLGDFRKAWATACITAGLYHVEKDEAGRERQMPERLFHDLRRPSSFSPLVLVNEPICPENASSWAFSATLPTRR